MRRVSRTLPDRIPPTHNKDKKRDDEKWNKTSQSLSYSTITSLDSIDLVSNNSFMHFISVTKKIIHADLITYLANEKPTRRT